MNRCFVRVITVLLLIHTSSSWAQTGAVPVFATVVERKPFVDEIEALGTLQAKENVALTSTVTELVTKVNFVDGQRVKQGDVLVEMNSAEENALLAEERLRMKEAERQVHRLEPLVKRNAASEQALDAQQLELQTAKARMEAIEQRIRQRKIIAPFDGVLGLRNISVGTLSQPGALITTIDYDSEMKLDFSVPEIFLSILKPGVNVEAKTSAWPNRVFNGTVASVDSRIDQVTRSIVVRAILQNHQHDLRPGLLMRVKLQKNPREALVIPEEALVIRGNEQSVLALVQQGDKVIAEKKIVEIGQRRKGEVEILSGLEEGMQIVTHGTIRIRPGSAVDVQAIDNNQSLTDLLNQKQEKAL
ncbi:Multidrug resistance protein MdtA [Thalassocella blandensis]|nr:Multidrug resistance protein MdtA [Thalassocella blandensis]